MGFLLTNHGVRGWGTMGFVGWEPWGIPEKVGNKKLGWHQGLRNGEDVLAQWYIHLGMGTD